MNRGVIVKTLWWLDGGWMVKKVIGVVVTVGLTM